MRNDHVDVWWFLIHLCWCNNALMVLSRLCDYHTWCHVITYIKFEYVSRVVSCLKIALSSTGTTSMTMTVSCNGDHNHTAVTTAITCNSECNKLRYLPNMPWLTPWQRFAIVVTILNHHICARTLHALNVASAQMCWRTQRCCKPSWPCSTSQPLNHRKYGTISIMTPVGAIIAMHWMSQAHNCIRPHRNFANRYDMLHIAAIQTWPT